MSRVAFVLSVTAFGLFSTGAAAQTHTDFSGRWTSDPEPTPTARAGGGQAGAARGGARAGMRRRVGDMGSGWGSDITITQDANQLTVEYAFFSRGDLQPALAFDYALDGSESTNSVMMGRGIQEETSTTAWDGNKLLITTVYHFPHPETAEPTPTELVRTLSLESPTQMVVEVTRAGVLGGPSTTTRTTYRRI